MNANNESSVQFMQAFLSYKHNTELKNYFDDLACSGVFILPKDLSATEKEKEVQIFIKRFCPELH